MDSALTLPATVSFNRARLLKPLLLIVALVGSFLLGMYAGDKRCAVPHGAKVIDYTQLK